MNLTIDMVNILRSKGFQYKELEHMCNIGMVYYYDGVEYTIGGRWDESPLTQDDHKISEIGTWLPDEAQLISWLQKNEYDISINYIHEKSYFNAVAKKEIYSVSYKGSGPDLSCCLYKLILKILNDRNNNSYQA